MGTYQIDGSAFVYTENSGRVRTILGYPTEHIVEQRDQYETLHRQGRELKHMLTVLKRKVNADG
jgi:hypothetical protein